VLLDRLRDQGWLELFTNTQMGSSQPDLAEFYANVFVTEGRVTSMVNGVHVEFEAQTLGDILGSLQMVLIYMSRRTNPCWER